VQLLTLSRLRSNQQPGGEYERRLKSTASTKDILRATAFIFARNGSKGIPNKNLRLLQEKPLIAHSIDVALATGVFDRVVVSTDSEQIAALARHYGAETPFIRPSELATDSAPEWLAWQHALRETASLYGLPDVFVSLPATSPFRSARDVITCVERLSAEPIVDIVVTACRSQRNPFFNMARVNGDGLAELLFQSDGSIMRRQDAPRVFDLTTVAYAGRPAFILSANGIWDGRVGLVEIPQERAIDIDTPFDLLVAESIAGKKVVAPDDE
jgi:CMP-N-acetylneuraminic acid synthetase